MLHVITTICRGGAENQLLILVKEQILSGRKVFVAPLKGEPELAADFEKLGAVVVTSLLNLHPGKQILEVKRILKAGDFIVHAHLPRAELITACASRSNNLVFSRHNAEAFFPGAPKLISNLLSRFVARRANAGIAISQAVKDFVIQRGEIPSGFPLTVVLYGASTVPDIAFPEVSRESLGIPNDAYVIGTVSRLAPQKDIYTLIQILSLYLSINSKTLLVIIGDGPQKAELSEFAKNLQVEDKIVWLGRRDRIRSHIRLFDVFALTSLYEGFGLVLLEAIQSNVPIVASNNSAIPEVLGRDFPGLCVTGSASDFVAKIESLESSEYKKTVLEAQSNRMDIFNSFAMSQSVDRIYLLKQN